MMNETMNTEMTRLESLQCTYWDAYKDAYGIRPRGIDTSTWSESDFEVEIARLAEVITENEREDEIREAKAIAKFESLVADTISMGAQDRETALRWIIDASDCRGDTEYFCYLNGLPYGYFK